MLRVTQHGELMAKAADRERQLLRSRKESAEHPAA